MLNNDTLIKITNRDNGIVGYNYVDAASGRVVHQTFQRGQTREIPYGEIKELYYQPGGAFMIKNLFRIDNEEALTQILGEVEPEYHYTEDDIKKLLLFGSLDELKDCLDFAPEGVIELVKDLAVSLKLDSQSKREAIKEKTEFDVSKAIEINRIAEEAEKEERANPSGLQKIGERRVQSEAEVKPTSRRVAPPKYEVIKK